MIDQARALLEQTYDRIATIDEMVPRLTEERDRLAVLRDSLTAFIEQPERSSVVSPTGAHAPADRGSDPADEGAPAAGRLGDGPASPAAASSTEGFRCPDCDAGPFAKPQGLGRHRSWKHPESFVAKAAALERAADAYDAVTIRATDPDPDEPPRPSERPTIAERIAARDASRNPRSAPRLELPPRIDRVVGE